MVIFMKTQNLLRQYNDRLNCRSEVEVSVEPLVMQIGEDMKIEESEGYKKLLESVMRDVGKGQGCFNASGCDHEFIRIEPQDNERLLAMGFKTQCRQISKCTHKYCDKFKWIIDRARHYAEKTGLEICDILNTWESRRTYWYMNYYQDANQPEIQGDNVRVFNTIEEFMQSIGQTGFRCPLCKGISKSPYDCTSGIIVPKIKDGNDGPCNWKVYGLFRDLGEGTFVFVKEKFTGENIFLPIAWEKSDA